MRSLRKNSRAFVGHYIEKIEHEEGMGKHKETHISNDIVILIFNTCKKQT